MILAVPVSTAATTLSPTGLRCAAAFSRIRLSNRHSHLLVCSAFTNHGFRASQQAPPLGIALALSFVSFLLIIAQEFRKFSRSTIRTGYVIFVVAAAMMLVVAAHHTKERETVIVALITTAILIASASLFGGHTSADLSSWVQPLSLCLSVLLLAWCINIFLLRSDMFQTTLSLGIATFLTFSTVIHTQMFIRHPDFWPLLLRRGRLPYFDEFY